MTAFDLYGGEDPRDIPVYSFREVALSVGVPTSTLRAGVGQANFRPLLVQPAKAPATQALFFFNLIEASVIAELRREHKVPMPRVRAAFEFLSRNVRVEHPLVETVLSVTPNHQMYIEHEGRRIDISAGGQWPLDQVIVNLLPRVNRGKHGIMTFYPRVAPAPSRRITPAEYAPIVVDHQV